MSVILHWTQMHQKLPKDYCASAMSRPKVTLFDFYTAVGSAL